VRQRALADGAGAAYAQWRAECDAVRDAYRRWLRARLVEKRSAFDEYNMALAREEHAARRYARLLDPAGPCESAAPPRELAQSG
jgi:hypothetical protein